MSLQGWQEPLIPQQVDGTALANSTTATSLLAPAAKFTLPANYMAIGRTLRVTARGRISNIVTTPGTITLDVRFGSVVVFNGGAVSMNITAKTNVTWDFEAILTCRAIGASTSPNMLAIGSVHAEPTGGTASRVASYA